MYQVTYTLKSKLLGDRVAEEITITGQVDDPDSIQGQIHDLRGLAFQNSASEAFYQEILTRTRTANNDLHNAQRDIEKMRTDWEKMANFMVAQGLLKEIPPIPLGDDREYVHPALLAVKEM